MRLTSFLILMVGLMGLLVGSTLYRADVEDNITRDIYNLTEHTLKWNKSLFDDVSEDVLGKSVEDINSIRIKKIVYKTLNCAGFVFFEIEKWFIELGYNNPQYNYLFLIRLVTFCIILYLLIPFLIICYIIYLLCSLIYNKFKIKSKSKKKGE